MVRNVFPQQVPSAILLTGAPRQNIQLRLVFLKKKKCIVISEKKKKESSDRRSSLMTLSGHVLIKRSKVPFPEHSSRSELIRYKQFKCPSSIKGERKTWLNEFSRRISARFPSHCSLRGFEVSAGCSGIESTLLEGKARPLSFMVSLSLPLAPSLFSSPQGSSLLPLLHLILFRNILGQKWFIT